MIRLLVSVGHQITNLPTYVFYIVNKPNLCVKLVQVVEKWGGCSWDEILIDEEKGR